MWLIGGTGIPLINLITLINHDLFNARTNSGYRRDEFDDRCGSDLRAGMGQLAGGLGLARADGLGLTGWD